MMWMLSLTLQMKIHLQTALANKFWCSVERTLVASDEIQVNVMQKDCRVLEVAKCYRYLLQTC